MKKRKFREFKSLAQDHTAGTWQSQVPNPGSWLMYSHSNSPYLVAFSLGPLSNKTKKTWKAQFSFLGFAIWFEPSHEDWQLSNPSITRSTGEREEDQKSLAYLLTICKIRIKVKVKVNSLSRVRLFATPWTVAYQAPPSMGFSRQVYWSGGLLSSNWS